MPQLKEGGFECLWGKGFEPLSKKVALNALGFECL